jgi:carbamoyl-phosphate synthase large subunit
MSKILIAGCGGAPSEGVVKSLLKCEKGDEIIGMGSEPTDLFLSKAKRKYIIPYANTPEYKANLLKILAKEKPDLVHFQNDLEIFEASKIRKDILETRTSLYMPTHEVIGTCVNKHKSYIKWKEAGIKVPENKFLNNENDLKEAFDKLAKNEVKIGLRE